MVTTSMRCILVMCFADVCCHCQSDNNFGGSSSWEKLQISPDTLSSIEYGNFLVEIYEHANNYKATTTASEKKYFYSPLALLDHKSAFVTYNKFTKQTEMRFRIEMWNDKVQNEVVKHLNEMQMDGHEIKSNKVRVIPLEKVILASKRPTVDYSLSPEWTNYDKSKILWLSLSCNDQKICEELANEMRSVPKHLDHFKLLYSLSSQTSQTKQTTISIDSVTSGTLVSNLLQKFEDKKEIFLTADDEKKMLTETATNIRMDTFDDYEVLSPDTESHILSILEDLLVTSRTTIKEQRDKMWDSVFWNDDNYRPDKTTKTLNEIINKLDTETQKKLADMFKTLENKERIQHNFDSNSWADVDRISTTISGKMANDSDRSRRVEISKEEIAKLLQESRDNVEWDGEKFVPKQMQLSRINLAKFRDSQSFQDRNLRVRYTSAELSAPIKFVEHAELTVTGEWNNLIKDELKATTELLNITVNNLVKINAELSNVKSDLTNKLEETKQEFVKTRADLTKKLDDLSTKLKEIHNLLGMTTNLSTTRTAFSKMPTSCADLEQMGQRINGFFLVKGSKRMETVYCNFNANQNDKQKWIGYADVKSAPVHFYVQRNSSFNTTETPIPFVLARVNEGNAMNLTSGIFTAPRPGTYFFSFTGTSFISSSSFYQFFSILYLNGNLIGRSYVYEDRGVNRKHSLLTVQSTLNLEKGDQVWVQIKFNGSSSHLFDSVNHYTHFTGFMLEEEIVASL
ncbi:C1q and tumor necrosis factor-related protein-like protein 2 [Daphnia pulex]|uniref:C1q and tumor necrosis factor-related protein-like protein 2 n=1 Tax=Daphnia pulex TaxID=6669 RepID=E9GD40_DAPPU|nr:C1q and tumor necrosis factor-related protein-like protein 2 [Daphnia pulex]|eukprot:EFX82669.1 C1q and tumor necrosis factor-related protein-like protein 2 [Daphnia pulex]